ncbi:hypothetical protein FXO37_17282 [Capsicum annuum]|nr:hypothetical protein FXO37_17282 [Capsicum annuum]
MPFDSALEIVERSLQAREATLRALKSHLEKAQSMMKIQADRKRTNKTYAVGDMVYIKLQPYSSTPHSKIRSTFHISQLKKKLGGQVTTVQLPEVHIEAGCVILAPEAILDIRKFLLFPDYCDALVKIPSGFYQIRWEADKDPLWNLDSIPKRKSSEHGQPILSPVERIQRQLHYNLQVLDFEDISAGDETVTLIYARNQYIPPNEIGLGVMFVPPPTTTECSMSIKSNGDKMGCPSYGVFLLGTLSGFQRESLSVSPKKSCLSIHQLEALECWEQHARCAYEIFDKDGNRAIVIEELASELELGPTIPVHAVLHDWIRHTDGKLSFLGFVKLLHGALAKAQYQTPLQCNAKNPRPALGSTCWSKHMVDWTSRVAVVCYQGEWSCLQLLPTGIYKMK